MSYHLYKKLSKKYCSKFGQIAIDKGYISAEQLHAALEVQRQQEEHGASSPRLLGAVLFELDSMGADQIENVLNTMQKMAREDRSTAALKEELKLTHQRLSTHNLARSESSSHDKLIMPPATWGRPSGFLQKARRLFNVPNSACD
jgi:aspartate/glutamate racemase